MDCLLCGEAIASSDTVLDYSFHAECLLHVFSPNSENLTCPNCSTNSGIDWYLSKTVFCGELSLDRKLTAPCPKCGQYGIADKLGYIGGDHNCHRCHHPMLSFQKFVRVPDWDDDGEELERGITVHRWCATFEEFKKPTFKYMDNEIELLQERRFNRKEQLDKLQKLAGENFNKNKDFIRRRYAGYITLGVGVVFLLAAVSSIHEHWVKYIGHPVERFFSTVFYTVGQLFGVAILTGIGFLVGQVVGTIIASAKAKQLKVESESGGALASIGGYFEKANQELSEALAKRELKLSDLRAKSKYYLSNRPRKQVLPTPGD